MDSKLITSLTVICALAAAACSGDPDPGPAASGGNGDGGGAALSPKEFFVKEVYPELGKNCALCHTPGNECAPAFLTTTAEGSYETLKQYQPGGLVVHPGNSNLIQHGAHTGPALTATLEEKITEWLSMERPGDAVGKTQLQALDEFGPCMKFDSFMSTGFYEFAYQLTDAGPCGSCHKTGEAGTWLSINQDEMHAKNQKRPWIKRLVKATFDADGNFQDFIASTRLIDKVEVSCGSDHPSASVYDKNKLAISEYFDATHQAWLAGDCEP